MKKNRFFSFACFLFAGSINAQYHTGTIDSLKVVQLEPVYVQGIKKTQQQSLLNFYKSNHGVTIEDILARLPELSLIRRGAFGMEPSIRYFSGGQINLQLDGMNIHGACTDKMDPVSIYIEPVNLENLQLQTANSGFLNGSSIGGTINMKMAEPIINDNKKLSASINSGYNSVAKGFYESIRLNYANGKWAFRTSVSFRNNQAYKAGNEAIVPFSQFQKLNYTFSAKYQQSKYGSIKIDLLGDDGWNIGYAGLPMDVGYAAARIGALSYTYENPNAAVKKWATKIYANSVKHFMDDSKRPLVPMHMDMPGLSKTSGFYTELELRKNKHQWIFRTDGSLTFLKASMTMYQMGQAPMYMLTWPDNQRAQLGIGANWQYALDSFTTIKISSRIDLVTSALKSTEAKNHVAIFDPSFSNRKDFMKNLSFLVSKKAFKNLTLSTSIGYAERMPTASELFGFYLFNASDNHDYIGNPHLLPEQSLQAECNILYRPRKNSLQLSLHYSKVRNYIVGKTNSSFSTMTIGATAVKTYSNLHYATIAGAEFSGLLKLVENLHYVGTLAYTHAIDQDQIALPFIPALKTVHSIRIQAKKFSGQVESEWVFKQSNINKAYGEDPTSAYHLLHARLGYSFVLNNHLLNLQMGIENILDKFYHDHLDVGNIPRPGRNLYFQLLLDINKF